MDLTLWVKLSDSAGRVAGVIVPLLVNVSMHAGIVGCFIAK